MWKTALDRLEIQGRQLTELQKKPGIMWDRVISALTNAIVVGAVGYFLFK
jgi:hypothetical protein